jgi:cobalamin biosynthetic protein CobC
MLEHGGNLVLAAQKYGIPAERWLDLSTGINPHGYPPPPIPAAFWRDLPQADPALIAAATAYYGHPHLLLAAGTQAVLQVLPRLRASCRVGIPTPTYAEHPKAWEAHGHTVVRFSPEDAARIVPQVDVLLLCNPNNPTGHRYVQHDLLAWHAQLADRGGWLIIDEAFLDATPQDSLSDQAGTPGLIILRSLGKFFGLAGARVGAVLAWPELLTQVEDLLGPWSVSGPAQWVARHALQDMAWQQETRLRLSQGTERLARLLGQYRLTPAGGTALFQWVITPEAERLHTQLAQQGILTRLFRTPSSLRFGLPGEEGDWQRLESALQSLIG